MTKARLIAAIQALPDDCLVIYALAHHLGLLGRAEYLDDHGQPYKRGQ